MNKKVILDSVLLSKEVDMLSNQQLTSRIDSFLSRKYMEFPDLEALEEEPRQFRAFWAK
jgi:hypothetical protein